MYSAPAGLSRTFAVRLTLVALFASLAAVANPGMAAADTITGEVMEFRDAGAYTYLKLRTAKGVVWAASSQAPVKKGSLVTLHGAVEMVDFQSEALQRTFPAIWLGVLGATAKPADGAPAIERARGPEGYTVAEVVSRSEELMGRTVTIRARVDRISPNVLGSHWVHLRDGSGSPEGENYDVVATSKELPNVGDIVVARGVVRTKVDLGMGHAFKVLVQDATFR